MSGLRRTFIFIAAAVCIVSLAANAPLIDPDEGLHAAIAQEMVRTGDYVTPTFLGEPFLDKPILFFWAEAASLRVFGMHEAAVRIPPLLFGLLGALTVSALGQALFDGETGAAAGIVYATMALPVGVSEVAVHDVALIPFLCVACYALWRAAASPRAWLWGAAAGAALGLSILTKGLVGVAFAGLFAIALAITRPAAIGRLIAALLASGVVAALIAAPWYVAMERAHPGYLHYYFVERHLEGYLTATQRHSGRPWWYYVPIVVGGALPWMPYAVLRARKADLESRLLWIWLGASIVFLSLAESKLATYVLPAFPAVAILAGRRMLSGAAEPRAGGYPLAFALQAIVAALLPVIAVVAIQVRFGASVTVQMVAAVAAAIVVAAGMRVAWRARRPAQVVARSGVAMLVAFAGVILIALPTGARWMTARDLAATLNASGTLPPRVLVLDERIGSLVFYLTPALKAGASADRFTDVSQSVLFQRLTAEPAAAILAVRDDRLARFERLFRTALPPDARSGTYTLFRIRTIRAALARQ
jgi:4-amino-4-deoxy-L-arabinose transferase-like glycosyltransferase